MIFITVGTHRQSFIRLLREIDILLIKKKIKTKVIAQIGNSVYTPTKYKAVGFFSNKKREKLMKQANIIITHGGAGSIIDSLNLGKKTIVVPRLKKFDEHVNDHQLDLTRALEKQGKITAVYSIKNLAKAIKKVKKPKKTSANTSMLKKLDKYLSD